MCTTQHKNVSKTNRAAAEGLTTNITFVFLNSFMNILYMSHHILSSGKLFGADSTGNFFMVFVNRSDMALERHFVLEIFTTLIEHFN